MKIARSALLTYRAGQLYDMVADIESYPLFLPRCHSARILSQSENQIVAELGVKFAALDLRFSTVNELTPNSRIGLELNQGPFRHLSGEWRFKALNEQACKVSYQMSFEFDSVFGRTIVSSAFESLITAQFDAFQKRAQQLFATKDG